MLLLVNHFFEFDKHPLIFLAQLRRFKRSTSNVSHDQKLNPFPTPLKIVSDSESEPDWAAESQMIVDNARAIYGTVGLQRVLAAESTNRNRDFTNAVMFYSRVPWF